MIFVWLASCSSALFCVVLIWFLLPVAQMFSANRAGLASQRKERPDKHWLCRSRSPLDVSWQHTRFIFTRGTWLRWSVALEPWNLVHPDANSWKHWHTKTYRNKKENVQASMGFILLSPSSITTNFLRSYEVVGACQAEWPPPLVASYFTATSALLFPFYHVMARFHYKYISWNRKLKQPLLLGVFWESCCIFCGLRSSRKRNPIKRHRGSYMIQSMMFKFDNVWYQTNREGNVTVEQ